MRQIPTICAALAALIILSACSGGNSAGKAHQVAFPAPGAEPTLRYVNCTDTDGGKNYTVKAKVFGFMSDGRYYENWDSCASMNTVKEWWCNGRIPSALNYNCQNFGDWACADGRCVPNVPPPPQEYCADSDGGNYPLVAGNATYWNATYGFRQEKDQCSGDSLWEWYCTGTKLDVQYKNCKDYGQDYTCAYDNEGRGYCKYQAPNYYCTDSDGGDNKYVYGNVTGRNQTHEYYTFSDECNSPTQVYEWYCNRYNGDVRLEDCGAGYGCVNGECIIQH